MSRKRFAEVLQSNYLLFFLILFAPDVAAEEKYQLTGKITYEDREFSSRAVPLVILEGVHTPFAAHTRADRSGNFKFKNLRPDLFTLVIYIPRVGESRQTVEVSSGLADSRGRVHVNVVFRATSGSRTPGGVSAAELMIPERALKEYEKAIRKMGKRDSEGAIEHLKKSVALAPQFVEPWNVLGTLAYKSNDFPLAERYFREALKHDPEYYPSVVNLGGALLSQGRMEESLQVNIKAVKEKPDDALAHSQLGLCYYFLEKAVEAELHLKRAISLDPGHFSFPQLPLADIYLRRQDSVSAAQVLEQFLALHPDAKQAPAVKKQVEAIRSPVR